MKLDFSALRPKLDLEGKYVDFGILRTSLSVMTVIKDLATTPPGRIMKNGEYRANCPKCEKEKSFALNINTNRFNCFNKGCFLKGGGVIDFVAKLCEVPAKEASHLLACAYGIAPYQGKTFESSAEAEKPSSAISNDPLPSETVTRAEFDKLQTKVERLSHVVWSQLFENGEIEEHQELFDASRDYELETALTG